MTPDKYLLISVSDLKELVNKVVEAKIGREMMLDDLIEAHGIVTLSDEEVEIILSNYQTTT